MPLRRFAGGKAQWLSAVLRVTPDTATPANPVWMVSRVRLPAEAPAKASAEFGGGFVVGEGKYRVDLLIVDEQNRGCVQHWSIQAKLSNEVRQVTPGMPAGAVDDISLRRWRTPGRATEPVRDISVLLPAAPMSPNRVRLRGWDRMMLMGALVSMLERLPLRTVRLTVFNLERQQVVYATPDLTSESFREAMDALNGLELGQVDYATLENRGGHLALMAELLRKEAGANPDAVVVLGPVSRLQQAVPEEALPAGLARIYNVQLRPFRMLAGLAADTVSRAVRKLGGRTKEVYTPDDFAAAIRELEQMLAPR